jgi:solute carrier family 25, member 33/36
MCGAIVTSPFDVVKTRLQSSLFHETPKVVVGNNGTMTAVRGGGLFYHFVETVGIMRYVFSARIGYAWRLLTALMASTGTYT